MADLDEFEVNYRDMTWMGACYDGPLEGQRRKRNRPMFMEYVQSTCFARVSDAQFRSGVQVDQIFYRWSDPLKKWVWQQSGTVR